MDDSTRVNIITIPPPSPYIDLCPDLAALVSLAWRSRSRSSKIQSTSSFLLDRDAVSSSIGIGQGTSFLVTCKTVPAIEQSWDTSKSKDGITVQKEREKSSKVGHRIVYKIARVQFNEQGDPVPEQRTNYASILLDLMVLSHEPILNHPNIVSFLGLAWGDNGFPDSCEIPVPITEYADLGNLADYQTQYTLPTPQKLSMLHGIAVGLRFLHECSITHGDVKSENVLLFSDKDHGIIAKVSDFGFAVLGPYGHFNFVPRGTLLWSAPEIRDGTLRTEEAHFSDVYSFGLLFWRVMIDGQDPLCLYFLQSDDFSMTRPDKKDLERLHPKGLRPFFEQDYLKDRALPFIWLRKYLALRLSQKLELDKDSNYQSLLRVMGDVRLGSETFKNYEIVVKSTLIREPSKRDLSSVITALSNRSKTDVKTGPEPHSITRRDGYETIQANNSSAGWNALRHAPPSVCNHILKQKLCKLATRTSADDKNIGDTAYGIACCLVSGMGSDRHLDTKKAREWLLLAANKGSTGAQAAIPRFVGAFGGSFAGLTPLLVKCAQWGSLAALEDLSDLDQDGYQQAKTFLRTNMCGVGGELFRYWNPPWIMARLKSLEYVENYLRNTPEPPRKIQVNPRGDGLLHAAASLAQLETVIRLVDIYKIDINQKNEQGETPLHSALRSGNIDIVDWLLDNEAEVATETTYTQESPLHWLISVEPPDLNRIAKRLLTDDINRKSLTVWAKPCTYAATLVSGYNDKWDNLTSGTPLHWAICRKRLDLVQVLLSYGADLQHTGPSESNVTPMELATFLHEHEIMKVMIDFKYPRPRFLYFDLGSARSVIHQQSTHEPGGTIPHGVSLWIANAIEGCDGWRMAFRHGKKAKQKMEETFKILGFELSYAHLNEGVSFHTPVNYAARYGYHEAVDMILTHMNGEEDINIQQGVEQWSPIFWAVHRDNKRMFRNLMDRGADLHLRINSPNRKTWLNWTLLHVAARSVIGGDLEICAQLLDAGLSPDGINDPAYGGPPQTPLAVAIEGNQFGLADLLRSREANVNATCCYIHFQRTKLAYECTILGCVVAANLRFSAPRLKYLLWPAPDRRAHTQPDFVVVPPFGFTALHVAAMGESIMYEPQARDPDVALEILGLLLEKYENAEEVNMQSKGDLMTALHIAVQSSNLGAVSLLLEMDEIDVNVENVAEQTPQNLAKDVLAELRGDKEKDEDIVLRAERILELLEEQ